jgi:hypothetical protein
MYALRGQETNTLIGNCGMLKGRTTYTEPEIGYIIRMTHQGHGFASEAAAAVIDECRAAASDGRGPASARTTHHLAASLCQLVADPAGAPPRELAPKFADERLHVGGKPVGAVMRAPRPVRQPGPALLLEPAPPSMKRLPRRSMPRSHFAHRRARQYLHHGTKPVLHQRNSIHATVIGTALVEVTRKSRICR